MIGWGREARLDEGSTRHAPYLDGLGRNSNLPRIRTCSDVTAPGGDHPQPHRYRQFKLSNDPNFVDKLRDVVGLYFDPPARAIVLSLDEKSQI